MTLLAGSNTPTTGGGSAGSLSTGNAYGGADSINVAVANGVVTSLNVYLISSTGTATLIYLGLYDSGGNLLCQGNVAPAAGLNTVAIAGGPTLSSGTQYHLVVQANGTGVLLVDDGTTFHRQRITNATLPLPSTLTFPGTNVNAGQLTMWADGTSSGTTEQNFNGAMGMMGMGT